MLQPAGDKIYECTTCKKYFVFEYYLKKHSYIHIAENTSAVNAESVSGASLTWWDTRKSILGRNYSDIQFVVNDFLQRGSSLNTAEFILERNHTNVTTVTKRFDSPEICLYTWESTLETSLTVVRFVTKVSQNVASCRDISDVCIATENRISVLRVEFGLRKSPDWIGMRVHVHTDAKPLSCSHCSDRSVLDGIIHWRLICWSRTTKELGSRVTFVIKNSPRKAILSIYLFYLVFAY